MSNLDWYILPDWHRELDYYSIDRDKYLRSNSNRITIRRLGSPATRAYLELTLLAII